VQAHFEVILEARDESTAGLPFGYLLTQIILQSGINVNGEPKMKIQQPISKQTLMKSNAQLWRDDSDDEEPPPAAMPVGFPDMASSSHIVPPSEPEVNYAQIMEDLAALQGGMSSLQVSMSSMPQSMSSIQLAVHSIDRRVEQNQVDLQECLKYHHPSSSDDEDVVDGILPMTEDVRFPLLFIVLLLLSFETISALLKLFGYILLCFPGPSETVRGSNFYDS
jgi:hypothetical protein